MFPNLPVTLNMILTYIIGTLLPVAVLAALGILVIRIVMNLVNNVLSKTNLEKAAHGLIKSVVRIVLYALLCLILASRLGIDVTGIVALASVLTLAISLSVQNVLTNVFGGFTLMSTHPFHSGDFVEIAGQSGTVREIGLTYTKLETADGKLVSIPNSAVTAAQIVNFTAVGKRRVDITVNASYQTPAEQVIAALVGAASTCPTAMTDPEPFAAVNLYGDNAVEYVLRLWSTADDYWTTLYDVNKRIKDTFDAQGVKMTYPHLNVHLDR